MRVFISSVVRGFEPFRDAASEAVTSLGYEVVRAEAFGARPETPRRACLKEVRASDLTIVLLGESYGTVQDSTLSATHEEFREARDRSSVAVLVQAGVEPDHRQEEFIREAQEWAGGRFTDTFESPSELRAKVTRLLHRYALDQASGGVDGDALEARAREALLAQPNRSLQRIHVVVAGGPGQTVVRPAQLDDPEFSRSILQRALFGPEPILDPSLGTHTACSGGRVSLRQGDRGGSLTVSEDGTVSVALPARPDERGHAFGVVPLIEEDIAQLLGNILAFVAGVLDHVDPARRMSHVLVLAAAEGCAHVGWRTRQEHAASPTSMRVPMGTKDLVVVPDRPSPQPRGVLTAGTDGLVADLLARLRRELRA